jgi:hypothetical protein
MLFPHWRSMFQIGEIIKWHADNVYGILVGIHPHTAFPYEILWFTNSYNSTYFYNEEDLRKVDNVSDR